MIAVGRVFGLSLPPRSSAALKNALKNFFFETAVLESRTLVLIIDEAQNLSDENLESLRLLLNYHVPQKKLLNILLFGQSELERRVNAHNNLVDRIDSWIRLQPLDETTAGAILDFRLSRAGLAAGQSIFAPEARTLLIQACAGLARRLTMLAHLSMEEAADRASTLVREDHVRAALAARGITASECDRRPVTRNETDMRTCSSACSCACGVPADAPQSRLPGKRRYASGGIAARGARRARAGTRRVGIKYRGGGNRRRP